MKKSTDFDTLGSMIKFYEDFSETTLLPGTPVIVRLDGKGFHNFTRGADKPFDQRLSRAMIETMTFLCKEYNAQIGYTQSDEITLIFKNDLNFNTDAISGNALPFNGRVQKLTSLLAAKCSVKFMQGMMKYYPEKVELLPHFDARIFQVPNIETTLKCLIWREWDATKNAISMAAYSKFSHKSLQNVGSKEKIAKLAEMGVDFDQYPEFFKRGTFCFKQRICKELSPEELAKIPENKRPTEPILRNVYVTGTLPNLKSLTLDEMEDMLFNNGDISTRFKPVEFA